MLSGVILLQRPYISFSSPLILLILRPEITAAAVALLFTYFNTFSLSYCFSPAPLKLVVPKHSYSTVTSFLYLMMSKTISLGCWVGVPLMLYSVHSRAKGDQGDVLANVSKDERRLSRMIVINLTFDNGKLSNHYLIEKKIMLFRLNEQLRIFSFES